ncbi:hypothetical protein J41TS12_48680 [Paenibacillus antibioticophila]|uniref:NodB homology domain-containing protein n=1 Tax=Paenibacillus antibioticophila TaxID=1274374 RepID=A0A919XVR4_9BACL|nr:polysaccharide deacetylase family protein [Paenibacillus antibioticophila]GIO40007.1 hypothetical protein J41TS12_48680 [Paenibacillus antibioticophila]
MLPYNTLIHQVPTRRRAVAVTFDDGPNPVYTPEVMEIFRKAQAKATFFMIGSQMEQHPEVVRAVHAEGHEIGNHSFTHPSLAGLQKLEAKDELVRTEVLIEQLTGVKPKVFRPPYFAQNEMVGSVSEDMKYYMIGALNLEANDWEMPGVEHILEKTRSAVKPGGILIFHDGFDDRSQTIKAVSILVSELIADGYELITVSELISSSP